MAGIGYRKIKKLRAYQRRIAKKYGKRCPECHSVKAQKSCRGCCSYYRGLPHDRRQNDTNSPQVHGR